MTKIADKGRPYLIHAPMGKLTQGTVFTCAFANRYSGKCVYGLTITARCDVAQNKYRILNYVPVVKLEDWLQIDGLEILIDGERKEFAGKIRKALENAGLTESITLSVSLNDIAVAHFPLTAAKKADKERAQNFRNLISDKESFEAELEKGQVAALDWFKSSRLKKIDELIRRLSRQDVTGFYFFERVLGDASPTGFVCLLREIGTIQKEVAEELAKGLSKDRWNVLCRSAISSTLSFEVDDFAMPISCIGSPTIEHLMQCFSNLFGRIGLPDPVAEEIDEIIHLNSRVN